MAHTSKRFVGLCFTALVLVALVTVGAIFNVAGLGGLEDRVVALFDRGEEASADRDSDQDGLLDVHETAGWTTADAGSYVTNANDPDSDNDGLLDGLEAGQLTGSTGPGDPIYAGYSHPGLPDTDWDGIGDGDEFLFDTNPRLRDSDEDGLLDGRELELDFDPTLANADGDSHDDSDEHARGSDPMVYDLDKSEAAAAFIGGAAAGDWQWAARRVGRLRTVQLESPEYLAGHLASGFLGFGDVRDLLNSIARGDVQDAVSNVAGLTPGAGDAAKTVSVLARFAGRGEAARRSVAKYIEQLPVSTSRKKALRVQVLGRKRLPPELAGGPNSYLVYKGTGPAGLGYIGITRNFAQRKKQHAAIGRTYPLEPIPGAVRLSRGQARSIEQFCITAGGLSSAGGKLENRIDSISRKQPYYDSAIAWGGARLSKIGAGCS